jgi:cell division protein FtsL
MGIVRRPLVLLLVFLMMAPAAQAQNHVISKSALDQALRQRAIQDQEDREAITSLLRRSEVREIAAKAGLSLEKAEAAVATLEGDDLHQIASQARQAQNDLAGGSNIVISTTTVIIVLLIIILIVLIAD